MADARPKGERVPEWMKQRGVKESEYLYMTKAQLISQQRPDKPLKVRVWATGMLQSAGYKGEMAWYTRKDRRTKKARREPLTPNDIITELERASRRYFEGAGITPTEEEYAQMRETKETVRRCLAELEEDGVAMRTDAQGKPLSKLTPDELKRLPSGKTRMYFWYKPKDASETSVSEVWDEIKARKQTPEVDKNLLPHISISKILNTFSIGKFGKSQISDPAFQDRVSHAFETARREFARALEVDITCLPEVDIKRLPIKVDIPRPPEVDMGGGALERKILKEKKAAAREVDRPPESEVNTESESAAAAFQELQEALSARGMSVTSGKFLRTILEALSPAPLEWFLAKVDEVQSARKIGTGILPDLARDAAAQYKANFGEVA